MPTNSHANVYSLTAVLCSLLAKRETQVVDGKVLPSSRSKPDAPQEMDQVVVETLSADTEDRLPEVRSLVATLGSVILALALVKAKKTPHTSACPQSGADRQTGRFCRKSGTRLDRHPPAAPPAAESILDEPIQVTEVTVGRVRIGKGIVVRQTAITSSPVPMATGELAAEFPEPLGLPK
jgi:hypothetical protein